MLKYLAGLSWIVLIASLVCYFAVLIPPEKFWPAGILVYGILPLLVINLLLLILLVILKTRAVFIPLMALLAGFIFIKITVHLNFSSPVIREGKITEILSYNVKNLDKVRGNQEKSTQMIQRLVADTAQVKCFQEFYSQSNDPALDVVGKMKEAGYNMHFSDNEPGNPRFSEGLAIFTKYPILNTGTLLFRGDSEKNCIYADLKIGGDTIRVYNVHLYSMRIPLYAYRDPDNYESKLKSLIRKLKNGAINRSREINQLIAHTEKCPYPFIICGDFNDIPYSHNYMTLRNHFTNVFEKVGQGFGFSFNNKLFFLRIDHHFVSNGIQPVLYRVDRGMKNSDHFPTRGIYRLP